MSIKIRRAAVGGVAGTVAMTALGLWAAPMMGIPPMNPAAMLAGAMGGERCVRLDSAELGSKGV